MSHSLSDLIDTCIASNNLPKEAIQLFIETSTINDNNVISSYNLLLDKMRASPPYTRTVLIPLFDSFVRYSDLFRRLILGKFQDFLSLCLEANAWFTFQMIDGWYHDDISKSRILRLSRIYLKNKLRIPINIASPENSDSELVSKILALRLCEIENNLENKTSEAKLLIITMESCFEILVPRDFWNSNDSTRDPNIEVCGLSDDECEDECDDDLSWIDSLIVHPSGDHDEIGDLGLGSRAYSIDVTLDPQLEKLESEDNSAVFDTLRDGVRLLQKNWIPLFSEWLNILSRAPRSTKNDDLTAKITSVLNNIYYTCLRCRDFQISIPHQDIFHTMDLYSPKLAPTEKNEIVPGKKRKRQLISSINDFIAKTNKTTPETEATITERLDEIGSSKPKKKFVLPVNKPKYRISKHSH